MSTKKDRSQEFIDFCEEHKRLPDFYRGGNYENSLKYWAKGNMNRYPEVKAVYLKYKTYITRKNRLQELIEFCEKNDRLPRANNNERGLRHWMDYEISVYGNSEVEAIRDKYKKLPTSPRGLIRDRTQEFINFCEEHGRLPRTATAYSNIESSLYSWASYQRDKIPIIAQYFDKYIRNKPGTLHCNSKDRSQEFIEFFETHNRAPVDNREGRGNYESSLRNWADRHMEEYPEIKHILLGEYISAKSFLSWLEDKSSDDLCANFALKHKEFRNELQEEIEKSSCFYERRADEILKRFLYSLERNRKWYDIPENRKDLIEFMFKKEDI